MNSYKLFLREIDNIEGRYRKDKKFMNALKLGLLLIFIGLVAIFLGTFLSAHQADFAGLIMIGPIPIVFGTSPLITIAAMVIGLLLMIASFIFGRKYD